MGKYLKKNSKKKDSLIETAYDNNVPIFCPALQTQVLDLDWLYIKKKIQKII